MDNQEIKELLELIRNSGIEEFEMEKAGVRLRIRNAVTAPAPVDVRPLAAAPAAPPVAAAPLPAVPVEEELFIFRAPIVGTFYLTPKPDAEPFVQVGDRITKNSVICIIEAMKIFNQIESDVTGTIVEILVENGRPVEFGEPLFKIRLE